MLKDCNQSNFAKKILSSELISRAALET